MLSVYATPTKNVVFLYSFLERLHSLSHAVAGCVCCVMGKVQCTIFHQAAALQASTFEETGSWVWYMPPHVRSKPRSHCILDLTTVYITHQ